MGKVEPSSTKEVGGVKLSMGPPRNTNKENKGGYTLNYNEYIVYNTCLLYTSPSPRDS